MIINDFYSAKEILDHFFKDYSLFAFLFVQYIFFSSFFSRVPIILELIEHVYTNPTPAFLSQHGWLPTGQTERGHPSGGCRYYLHR